MNDETMYQSTKRINPELEAKIKQTQNDVDSRHGNLNGGGDDEEPRRSKSDKNKVVLLSVIIALLVAIIGVGAWMLFANNSEAAQDEAAQAAESKEVELQQELANSEFENLEHEFAQFETQRTMVVNDSAKIRLTEKYEAAKLQVEKLQAELKNQSNKSSAEIQKLRDEIKTLRDLLKHYIEEIDRLNQENEALRTENAEIKSQNEQLSSQVASTTRQNEVLNERMTLAEKLNVTNVSLSCLNSKDKNEKKVKNAKKLVVTFTIPQNNSTPVGEKTIYLRITSPSGDLLRGGSSFKFEGATLDATAKKSIEYSGEEIAGISIYWTANVALTPGEYTVELFADNYRLKQSKFTLK
jgi:flagellar basal body-associated protein FliL